MCWALDDLKNQDYYSDFEFNTTFDMPANVATKISHLTYGATGTYLAIIKFRWAGASTGNTIEMAFGSHSEYNPNYSWDLYLTFYQSYKNQDFSYVAFVKATKNDNSYLYNKVSATTSIWPDNRYYGFRIIKLY